jgi:hypothetical protein
MSDVPSKFLPSTRAWVVVRLVRNRCGPKATPYCAFCGWAERPLCIAKSVQNHGRPIQRPPGQPCFQSFTVIVRMPGLPDERCPIVQTAGVDDGAASGRRFTDCSDINAASATQQIIGGARTKTISLYKRPIRRSKIGVSRRVGHGSGSMRAAE